MAATRALVTRSNPGQPSQVYLADAAGQRLAWIEENRLDAVASLCALLAAHVAADLRHAPRRRRHRASLPDALAAARARPALSGLRPGLWRAGHGPAGDARLGQSAARNIWSSMAGSSSRSTIAARPTAAIAFETAIYHAMGGVEVEDQLAGVAWLRGQPIVDPRPDRGLRLVLWRLYDPAPARGRAGHLRAPASPARRSPAGSSTTPIIPSAISAIPRPIRRPIARPTRSPTPTRSPIRCC